MTRSITRRAALQSAALAAACGVASAAAVPASQPRADKPGDRDCLWIPTLDNQFCCGMIHRPTDQNKFRGKRPAVLMLHGLVGSKDQPHRIFVTLAEALSKSGYISLRFDLLGRGDSQGASVDATPKRDLQNARDALAALQAQPDVNPRDITVLGMSWGGTLAAYLAGETTAVKRVVLWSSCPTDKDTWRPIVGDENGRAVSDVFGSLLSKEFYDEVPELMPASQLKRHRQPVLMLYGTRDEVIRQANYETCASELQFGDVQVTSIKIDNADHALMRHAFEKEAIEKSVQWLEQQ